MVNQQLIFVIYWTPVPSAGATGQAGFTGLPGFFCCFPLSGRKEKKTIRLRRRLKAYKLEAKSWKHKRLKLKAKSWKIKVDGVVKGLIYCVVAVFQDEQSEIFEKCSISKSALICMPSWIRQVFQTHFIAPHCNLHYLNQVK